MRDRPLRVVSSMSDDELIVKVGGLNWDPPAADAADAHGPRPAENIDEVSALERAFPNVAALLQRLWGRAEATHGLHKLFLDKRGMARQWPAPVWDELLLLRDVHHARLQDAGDAGAADELVDPHRFSILEQGYGHVVERLIECWHSPGAFAVVFEDLIIDGRGDRQGWPAELWRELLFLQELRHRVQHDEEAMQLRLEPDAAYAAADLPGSDPGVAPGLRREAELRDQDSED